MAYAALVSLSHTIDLILNHHQYSISPEVKDQIIYIDEYVTFLQAFLECFPAKSSSCEGKIRYAAHIAEGIIELLISEQIHKSHRTVAQAPASSESSRAVAQAPASSESMFKYQPRGMWRRIQSIFKPMQKPRENHELQPRENHELQPRGNHELNIVTKKIESIVGKVMEIKNKMTVKDELIGGSSSSSSRDAVVQPAYEDVMVGFDDDLMEIKCRLCGESFKLEVVPIVGMGGIGKTTLARNIHVDPLIVEHFEIRVWVTVSQSYNVQDIVSGLLVSMDLKNKSIAEHHVYQKLKGRRYLVVLDDMWSTEAWDDLKMMFPDDNNGSRIMLTTRLLDVADYVDPYRSVTHVMHLMSDLQSWDLFKQKLFKHDHCPVELEFVGKKIVRRCRGLPLAIVVISGLLSAVGRIEAAWNNVFDNINSALSVNDELDKILSLSYTHLPHHLRPCLLYVASFPEDYKMRASEIIKLWVAEGFLKPNGCKKSFEEIAEEYLEDLVKRSLVFVTKRKTDGRIKSFSIHDVLREMCIKKAQEEDFFIHVRRTEGIKIVRRLSIFHSDLGILKNDLGMIVHTMKILKNRQSWPLLLRYLILLRILDLSDSHDFIYSSEYRGLPDQLFELFHLRYLSCNCVHTIPEAILNLQNLQTLIIGPRKFGAPIVTTLPVEIWTMPRLRHLVGFFSVFLPFEGAATISLDNLQTFSVIQDFYCAPQILKMIPNLKKMGLFCTNTGYINKGNYELHNLIHLEHLEKLKIQIQQDSPYREKLNPAFPNSLKKLTLSHLGSPWICLKDIGMLPNLEVLKLRDYACDGDTWETSEGEFSQLKFLEIKKSNLQYWITEASHFPRLKCLVLRYCQNLCEIPDDIGEIPTLELIDVNYNSKSLLESAKQIQDYQQSFGNEALQVLAHKSMDD